MLHLRRVSKCFRIDYEEVYRVITAEFLGDQFMFTCENKRTYQSTGRSVRHYALNSSTVGPDKHVRQYHSHTSNKTIASLRRIHGTSGVRWATKSSDHVSSTYSPAPIPSPHPPTLACKPTPLTSNRARHTGDASGSTVTDTDTVRISRTVPKIMNTRRDIFSRCG